ncbi:MAG: peptide/nickel transport system permease protein [Acidobacteriota bacterium]|jgi:peptide/nickel transport system permease protein|nr:peptide/nickel transport system permease protein [Acidobacteriota bacterium]
MPESRRLPGSLRAAIGIVGLVLLIAVAAPLLAPYSPSEQLDPVAARYRPPGTVLQAVHMANDRWRLAERVERVENGLAVERLGRREILPAAQVLNLTTGGVADRRVFLLGTDKFGRDVLSRMIHGARVSLAVGVLSVALALTLGVAIGSAAALGGPVADSLLMRTVDAMIAYPFLFLMILLSALFSPSTGIMILLLGSTGWTGISRLTRAQILGLNRREFVVAARAIGQTPMKVLLRHLLPNALTPVLIRATLMIGNLILLESALSFLGLGIQPPTPTWGNMVAEGRESLSQGWWIATFPGALLAVTIIGFNLLADGLRDFLDPRLDPRLEAAQLKPRDPAMLPPS